MVHKHEFGRPAVSDDVTLYTWTRDGVSVDEFLRVAAAVLPADSTAFVSTPREWFTARLRDGVSTRASGVAADVARAFELRIFGDERELRWRRNGTNGRAALLALTEVDGPAGWMPHEIHGSRLDQRYLLWGQVESVSDRWATLVESRIGSLDVPVDSSVESGDQLVLVTAEILAGDDSLDGMVVRRDEVLLQISTRREGH